MLIVQVFIHVKREFIEPFRAATEENARNSLMEPGIARFDLLQQEDDPTRFLLLEVYRDVEATVAHKGTAHYATWRDTVAEMMASPRTSIKYHNLYPGDGSWG